MSAPIDDRVAAVRAFNRFYTSQIGVLRQGLLRTRWSLTEARVIYELGRHERLPVAALRAGLAMDAGYLSRVLARLETAGIVERTRSDRDGRRQIARLTGRGRRAFATLDSRSATETRELLEAIGEPDQRRLAHAMSAIERILGGHEPRAEPVIRRPRPGDLGWIVARHGELYAEEYGWDEAFEALVAGIVANYAQAHDPAREAAWIAEAGGDRAGCVMCVRKSGKAAQLRLLLVEPWARRSGIGSRLIGECLSFAREAGYERVVLWTNDPLADARRLYERAGFALESEAPHHSFGHDMVEQTWEKTLDQVRRPLEGCRKPSSKYVVLF
ncbi:MAG: GNAT family N-acetyltransferase [Thermoleophilaceae bacterium]